MKYLLLLTSILSTVSAAPVYYDVVVYGGTSGGVVAATQAAKSGKSVVLISPTAHLGGLTSNGLGLTDLGSDSILGGLSREFYRRAYLHYQNNSAWNWQTQNLGMSGQGGPGFNSTLEVASIFEPKVAEGIFNQFIAEDNVPVITGRLDLTAGVVMNAGKISHLRLEDGREFSGKMFIDASYEGDLLPGAGVSFTVGREANATYNETISGIQTARSNGNQLRNNIDPYVTAGNAASGLLPGVNPDPGGSDGTGDAKLQAYCFRMCLTDVAANRVMIPQPPGYNEADYELLFRSIEAGQTNNFFKFSMMPNRKTDSNNTGGISTDFIGKNYGPGWDWTTLDHDERLALAQQHENWQRGLVWTLQNHLRVPQAIRTSYANWGLPADEFTDNGNWPRQIYVREARRMVSDYVMTQANCQGSAVAADSVGLAAYAMDSHHVQRHVKNGMVKNEGDVQVHPPQPYPISYRSIIPKRGECTNLLVPWSLSASHMAFGSIRMEPVFMGLAQSAAIAASMAIDQNIAVQDLSYTALRPVLQAAGVAIGGTTVVVPDPNAPPTVVDNADTSLVTITGSWTSSTSVAGYHGTNFFHDGNAGQGTKQVFFRIPSSLTGLQRVYLRWTENANRASNIPIEIIHRDGTATTTVNQRANGAKWNLLGMRTFTGASTEGLVIKTTGADGFVIADAVGFSAVGPNEDSDEDGITDVRESILGMNPEVSDAAFIAAVKSNPEYFDLHSENEIQDLLVTQPFLSGSGAPSFNLGFSMLNSDWSVFEDFSLTIPGDVDRRFFRLALQSEPSKLVTSLAAGLNRKIVVYGTSLTAGGAWPGLMNTWLSAKYPGKITIVNSGLSGKNSATGLSQLSTKVLAHNPDIVFIEFAMNDAFLYSDGTPQLSVAQAQANLIAIIDAIQAQNPAVEIILQTMNSVWNSPTGSNQSATLRPNLAAYYQMYRDVATARGLMLIDHHPNWVALQQTAPATFQSYIADGVHPNAEGVEKITFPLLQWKLSGGLPLP